MSIRVAPSVPVSGKDLQGESLLYQDKLREITQYIHQCEQLRVQSAKNIEPLNKLQEKIALEKRITSGTKSKLKYYYKNAIQDAEQEEDSLRKCLSIISDIRTVSNKRRMAARGLTDRPKEALRRGALMKLLQVSAMHLPLWVASHANEKPPPLCGAIPAEANYVGKIGDMVAALVKGAEGDENWILAEVSHYNSVSNKYEVDDIDEEGKERHVVSRRRVIALPLYRANPITNPEAIFQKGTLVSALYPQTTCFYRALVDEMPVGPQDEYSVLFEDNSYPEGYSPALTVAQRYVICCKEIRKK